jgi:glycosyltransferase involved in cell wall biosynthesis
LKVLLEMRPALEGHAGIPQEVRLLFRGLTTLEGISVEGLLQSSGRILARGLPHAQGAAYRRLTIDQRIHRLSRVVVSLRASQSPRAVERLAESLRMLLAPLGIAGRALLGMQHQLGVFEGEHFQDFIWREVFARTLPVADMPNVSKARMRVARTPWNLAHSVALLSHKLGHALYPRIDTRDFDVMIAETPYPGIVSRRTQMVVRYHDAVPILMPHTITDKSFHQAAHYHALRLNVKSDAWFACVSDATRRDLLSIFPEVESRSLTIHNMVSHHYHEENTSAGRLYEIVRTRRHSFEERTPSGRLRGLVAALRHSATKSVEPDAMRWMSPSHQYLLMVSTIEPRKNHATLLSAWEQLRQERFPDLKLVIVGSLGWDHASILRRFRPWLATNGDVQMLEEVPAAELRVLYHHAAATVCPSLGEGFDFSGIEAMRCGNPVVASDIQVHRDVFGPAAEYFKTYSPADLARAVEAVIDPAHDGHRRAMIERGREVSAAYLPERILPQWQTFLQGLPRRQ